MGEFHEKLGVLLPQIMANPELYLHSLDMEKGQGLLIRAERNFFKNALFLDQRVLTAEVDGAWVPLNILFGHVEAGAGGKKPPGHFIFHTGHSGSTLVSKLLDEVPSVLGLREPAALRTLAAGHLVRRSMPNGAFEGVFNPTYQLLTRRFSPEQQVVIKATSMCNNLAPALLRQNPANRALLLYVSLEVYLANMLDKSETPDIEGMISHRLATLNEITPGLEIDAVKLTRPERIALSWLAEAAQLWLLSSGDLKPRTLLMDFDAFLKQRDIHLELILNHFGLPGGEEALGRLLASPAFRGYAKKPDFPYTQENRTAILSESRGANKAGIKAGLAFAREVIARNDALKGLSEKLPLGD